MSKLSIGVACIHSGSMYINLMEHCEKIEVIGAIREGRPEISELEFAVIAKPSLMSFLKSRFATVNQNDLEIVFTFQGIPVSILKLDHNNWNTALAEAS